MIAPDDLLSQARTVLRYAGDLAPSVLAGIAKELWAARQAHPSDKLFGQWLQSYYTNAGIAGLHPNECAALLRIGKHAELWAARKQHPSNQAFGEWLRERCNNAVTTPMSRPECAALLKIGEHAELWAARKQHPSNQAFGEWLRERCNNAVTTPMSRPECAALLKIGEHAELWAERQAHPGDREFGRWLETCFRSAAKAEISYDERAALLKIGENADTAWPLLQKTERRSVRTLRIFSEDCSKRYTQRFYSIRTPRHRAEHRGGAWQPARGADRPAPGTPLAVHAAAVLGQPYTNPAPTPLRPFQAGDWSRNGRFYWVLLWRKYRNMDTAHPMDITEATARIAELEDELKARDRRIEELKADLDQERQLVSDQKEFVEDAHAMIERWIEAFDMQLDDDGSWSWKPFIDEKHEIVQKYNELLRNWNKFVPQYNEKVAPTFRNIGRPLAAGPGQIADVKKRRKAGQSLRNIAWETNLSLRTVRTIVERDEGRDRATLSRLDKIAPDRAAAVRARRQAKDIAALPDRINTALKTADELRKRAKGTR